MQGELKCALRWELKRQGRRVVSCAARAARAERRAACVQLDAVPPQHVRRDTTAGMKEAEQQMTVVNRWMTELEHLDLS